MHMHACVCMCMHTAKCVRTRRCTCGQITWVTVVAPVILVIVLVIQTVQLDGAADGISFYIGKFHTSELANLDLW